MIARRFLASLFLLPALNAQEATPVPTPSPTPQTLPSPTPAPSFVDWVNQLDDAQVQKAVEVIETQFHGAEALDASSKMRALLLGLDMKLDPGIGAGPASKKSDESIQPFLVEILDGVAGYIRPGTLDQSVLSQMDAALENFSGKQVPAVILDLRALSSGDGMDSAAEFARRFAPKGKILFTIENPSAKQERILTSDKDPLFSGILLVLVDQDTAGAAEVLAATLRDNAQAMVVGMGTAGEAVEFSEFQLGGDKVLRVAISKVVLPISGAIFPNGLTPDVEVGLDPEERDRIFELGKTGGVSRFVFDVERPRLNEAALVSKTNPEISTEENAAEDNPKDYVLQRAVDLVTAIRFFKK